MRSYTNNKKDYKKGDIVVSRVCLNWQVKEGTLGTVIEPNEMIGACGVSFFVQESPEHPALHNLHGRIPTRTGWWCGYSDIKPYEEAEAVFPAASLDNLF